MPRDESIRLVQPWGRKIATESTTVSTHRSVAEAFRELGRLEDQMLRTGGRADAIALIVIDADGNEIRRPNAN